MNGIAMEISKYTFLHVRQILFSMKEFNDT